MAYYVLKDGDTRRFVPNPNYTKIPPVLELAAAERRELHLVFDSPVHDILITTPSSFEYLSQPEKYLNEINYLAQTIETTARQ